MSYQTKRQTLSVVLATRNEEAFLGECLESVKLLADEIIVFDENSTDQTRKIAHKYKAKVFLAPHHQIFHITKNKAIRKATSDWVLQLDADERLTEELKKEISQLLLGKCFGVTGWISPIKKTINRFLPIYNSPLPLSQPAEAYYLVRKNLFLKRYLMHTGQYPDPLIRLFKNGKAILPAKDVHEQMTVDGNTGWLISDLEHYATPDFSRYLKRENYYSSLEASLMYQRDIKITNINTLNYLFVKPFFTFLNLFIRRRGFLDGFPGFVFSLYSGFHHAFSYMKLWEIYRLKK